MNKTIRMIESQLNLTFNQPALIQQAFYHTSYANEQASQQIKSNERLEFLGDAVLELMVSDFLYHQYPTYSEGQLTRMRAQLVCEPSLAYLTKQLGYDQFLQLGYGEEQSGGRQRDSILADLFEAVLGAIYLDQGYQVAQAYLSRVVFDQHQVLLDSLAVDYKTKFQELVQKQGSVLIQYRLLEQSGPAHASTFVMGLYVDGQLIAQGQGKSKKNAEMMAAKTALNFVDKKGKLHVSK